MTRERGALRQSWDGIFIYDEHGRTEVSCAKWDGQLKMELEDFDESATEDRPVFHNGKWGKATLEVCLAILQSSRDQREQQVFHQVSSPH